MEIIDEDDPVAVTSRYFSKCCKSRELTGHKKKIHSVGWNCAGRKLASGSMDHSARVWTLDARGQPVGEVELKGHTDCVEQLHFHPSNPDVVATASSDRTVRIWDTRTGGKCTSVIDTKGQNINITWSPDGNHIAVGSKKDIISIIDANKFKVAKNHKFTFEVNETAWSPSGEQFLLTTGNGTVEIMRFPSFERLHCIQAHTGHCYCTEFDPTARYLATGGADALVSLWDVQELVCLRTFPRLESPIRTLSFSHEGRLIASASEDFKIDISEVESGRWVHTVECRAEVNSIAWNPTLPLLAYAGDDPHGRSGSVFVFGFPY